MAIEVDGKKYKIVETLPYHGCGMQAKAVETPEGEKIAVKCGGKWIWWTPENRLGVIK